MYPPQRGGIRSTMVHDLVPLRFPEWVQGRTKRMHGAKYRNAARTCDVIFVNSVFTKGEVVELLGVAPEKVVVAYPGVGARGPRGLAPTSAARTSSPWRRSSRARTSRRCSPRRYRRATRSPSSARPAGGRSRRSTGPT